MDETITIRERRDGTLAIECRAPRWLERPTKHDRGLENDYPEPIILRTEQHERPIERGDQGCLVSFEDVSPDGLRRSTPYTGVSMNGDPDGVPGNSDHTIKRLHGWRGTTDDASCQVWGWRRVISVEPLKRGLGWRVMLSVDLKPEDD
jgi:hypothetical protein